MRGTFDAYEIEPSLEAFEDVARRSAVGAAANLPADGGHGEDPDAAADASPAASPRRRSTSATTVGEVLDGLYDRYDGLRERIAEDGDLRRFVNVYVGGEDIRFLDGLDTSVEDGDEVTILPAVAGGS